jgi:hypothetical protein
LGKCQDGVNAIHTLAHIFCQKKFAKKLAIWSFSTWQKSKKGEMVFFFFMYYTSNVIRIELFELFAQNCSTYSHRIVRLIRSEFFESLEHGVFHHVYSVLAAKDLIPPACSFISVKANEKKMRSLLLYPGFGDDSEILNLKKKKNA